MAHAKRKPNTKKLQGKRILVVEDQPLVSEILIDLLGRYRLRLIRAGRRWNKSNRKRPT
jgi:hypothetical protein